MFSPQKKEVKISGVGCINKLYGRGEFFQNICINQIIILYTLSILQFIFQL